MFLTSVLILSANSLSIPSYPEGGVIPRNMTKEEARYVKNNPITVPRGVTSPPVGPVHCVAEY
jgi:hypothetical protein